MWASRSGRGSGGGIRVALRRPRQLRSRSCWYSRRRVKDLPKAYAVAGGLSVVAIAPSLSIGCRPKLEASDEIDLVVTVQDPRQDFAKLRTYDLAERVIDLCRASLPGAPVATGIAGAPTTIAEPGGGAGKLTEEPAGAGGVGSAGGNPPMPSTPLGEDCMPIDHGHDEVLLDTLEQHMNTAGFRRVHPDDDPDVVLFPGVVAVEGGWLAFVWYPWYWDRWGTPHQGDAKPYRWEYPAGAELPFAAGTVAVTMVKPSRDGSEGEEAQLEVPWAAVVGRLYEKPGVETRIRRTLARAFDQSPYLGSGK